MKYPSPSQKRPLLRHDGFVFLRSSRSFILRMERSEVHQELNARQLSLDRVVGFYGIAMRAGFLLRYVLTKCGLKIRG